MDNLSNPLLGIAVLGVLFVGCFVGVHAVLFFVQRKKGNKEQDEVAPTTPPEPVYYIVEKKRKRIKTEYTTPKEIKFR